nr:hypothetical protein [Tanacetum cinerariifolium]
MFASSKPKNFSDDFLLTNLTYMFEKPDVQAQVWKNQRTVHGLAKTLQEPESSTFVKKLVKGIMKTLQEPESSTFVKKLVKGIMKVQKSQF